MTIARRGAAAASALAAVAAAALVGGSLVRGTLAGHVPNGPLTVVDGWGRDGVVALCGLLLVVAAAYPALRATLVRARPLEAPALARLALALAPVGAFVAWGAVFSSDAYAYAAYGELARLGANPFLPMPGDRLARSDPFIAGAWAHWPDGPPPCLYGPLFVAFAKGVVGAAVALGGGLGEASLGLALDGFRAASILSLGVAALALARLLPPAAAPVGVAAFALHPVVLWGAVEGHNDTEALALGLVGLVLAGTTSRVAVAFGGALAALSGSFKAPGLLLAFAAPGRVPRGARRVAAAAGAAAGVALVVGPGLAAQWPAFGHLARHSTYRPSFSAQGVAIEAFARLAGHAAPAALDIAAGSLVVLVPCAALAVVGGARLIAAGRRGATPAARDGRAEALVLLAAAAFAALPNPQPWYAAWFGCLAAGMLVRADGSIAPGALGLWAATFSLAVRYLADAAGALDDGARALVVAAQLAPLLAGLVASARGRSVVPKKVES